MTDTCEIIQKGDNLVLEGIIIDKDFIDLFWSKVSKDKECWIWNGSKDSDGYGAIKRNGKMRRAHRIAYSISNGEIPDRLVSAS